MSQYEWKKGEITNQIRLLKAIIKRFNYVDLILPLLVKSVQITQRFGINVFLFCFCFLWEPDS